MGAVAERIFDVEPVLPVARRTLCPGCSTVVLEVPLADGELTVLVEPREFLLQMRCPECASGRLRLPERMGKTGRMISHEVEQGSYFTRDLTCWRCGASPGEAGWVGAEPEGFGVRVDESGVARPLDLSRLQTMTLRDGSLAFAASALAGVAIHRAHLCRSVRAAP